MSWFILPPDGPPIDSHKIGIGAGAGVHAGVEIGVCGETEVSVVAGGKWAGVVVDPVQPANRNTNTSKGRSRQVLPKYLIIDTLTTSKFSLLYTLYSLFFYIINT
jgi:hypothetical protein